MKEDGEPDAGDLHVRFDGREVETGKGMEGPQNRGRRTGAEDDRKVGDGISLLLFSNTTWISLHRATSRPYSLPTSRTWPLPGWPFARLLAYGDGGASPDGLDRTRATRKP